MVLGLYKDWVGLYWATWRDYGIGMELGFMSWATW